MESPVCASRKPRPEAFRGAISASVSKGRFLRISRPDHSRPASRPRHDHARTHRAVLHWSPSASAVYLQSHHVGDTFPATVMRVAHETAQTTCSRARSLLLMVAERCSSDPPTWPRCPRARPRLSVLSWKRP